jgi:hypothetical protein
MPFTSSGRRDLNPGPHKATFLAYSELFDWKELSAHSPECSQLQLSGSTGFVGDW